MEELKYPIGRFIPPAIITKEMRVEYIDTIERFPNELQLALTDYSSHLLETQYRPEGWTVRQVVHHCADSHMNSYIRFKLALTEDSPIIKPYMEDRWALLSDTTQMPIEPSLSILLGIHSRWTILLQNMSDDDFAKTFMHPEHNKLFRLDTTLSMYAWHCRHHFAHILLVTKNQKI